MALNAFMKVKGQKQGIIKGSVSQKGREGSIMIIAASHEIVSPRDPASGLPTGKRQHKPFIVTKEVDRSSPLLYQALSTNENLPECLIQFWQPTQPTGQERQHYSIKLINANIASIDFRMLNNKDPDLMRYAEYEEIAFTYQNIQWLWVDGGIMAGDDWTSPVG